MTWVLLEFKRHFPLIFFSFLFSDIPEESSVMDTPSLCTGTSSGRSWHRRFLEAFILLIFLSSSLSFVCHLYFSFSFSHICFPYGWTERLRAGLEAPYIALAQDLLKLIWSLLSRQDILREEQPDFWDLTKNYDCRRSETLGRVTE